MSKRLEQSGPSLARSRGSKVLVAAVLTLSLAACKHDGGPQVAGWSLVDPSQRHPIMVSQQPATLSIHVPRGGTGLSTGQRAEVAQFAGKYRASDSGNSRLVIAAPSGSGNEVSAMNAVQDIRDILVDGGFDDSSIAVEAYSGEGRGDAPVRISYMRYVAEGPECGNNWSENLARNPKNFNYPDFGCSQQHNLAAMVANPADLLGPRSEASRNAERRDDVFSRYVKGKSTGADKSDDEKVKVQN